MNYLHSRDIDSLKETKVINIMNIDKNSQHIVISKPGI